MLSLGTAKTEDWPQIIDLLHRSELKEDGLADHLQTTLIARVDGTVVGVAALEVYGASALLRSVAVDAALRGQGLGQRLVQAALDMARQRGIDSVYLLTQTAENFFPRFGFRRIAREETPPGVQTSIEFNGMCPVSSVVMVASLK